jgi:RNA polymerase sigma-70 factor, ECF subfamily
MHTVNPDWFNEFIDGKSKGMAAIYHRYYTPLIRYISQRLRREEEAEDIVQECMKKAWQQRHRYETPDHLRNSLYTMVKNTCIDSFRKDQTRDKLSQGLGYLKGAGVDDDDSLDLERLHAELIRKIMEMVGEMKGRQSEILRMTYFDKYTDQQIAERLGMKVDNVRLIRHRTLKVLRGTFKDEQLVLLVIYLLATTR